MKEVKQVLWEGLPNTQIVLDEQGYKWYRKGLNSSKDRIFHSWALHGWYARAWTGVNDNVLNITKEHDFEEHSNLKNKEPKRGKPKKNLLEAISCKPKKIKENKELFVTSNKFKDKKKKAEFSFQDIVINDLPFDPNWEKFEWKSDDNQQTNKQTESENKENLFALNNPPDITFARIKRIIRQEEIIDWKKEIEDIRTQLGQIFNSQNECKESLLNWDFYFIFILKLKYNYFVN